MELYQIRYFIAVSRTLNFTKAADECNVTQPALTRAIKKLEDELGGELFRRERTNTHLTALGKAMLPLLQQSIDSANAAKQEAENYGCGEVAPLRIGISETIMSDLFSGVFVELQLSVTGLVLNILRKPASDIISLLQAGDIDFGIVAACEDCSVDRLRSWPLFDEDIVFCLDKGNASALPLTALDGQPVIARPYCESSSIIQSALESMGIRPNPKHVVDCDADIECILGLAETATFLPKSTADRMSLDWYKLEGDAFLRSVMVIELAGRQHNMAASRFLRLVRSADWQSVNEAVA